MKSFGRLSDLGRQVLKFLVVYGCLCECAEGYGRARGSSWRTVKSLGCFGRLWGLLEPNERSCRHRGAPRDELAWRLWFREVPRGIPVLSSKDPGTPG